MDGDSSADADRASRRRFLAAGGALTAGAVAAIAASGTASAGTVSTPMNVDADNTTSGVTRLVSTQYQGQAPEAIGGAFEVVGPGPAIVGRADPGLQPRWRVVMRRQCTHVAG